MNASKPSWALVQANACTVSAASRASSHGWARAEPQLAQSIFAWTAGASPNMGDKLVRGLCEEGSKLSIHFQVTKVVRPLTPTSKLTAGGQQVQFGKQHGEIIDGVTGKKTRFGGSMACSCCVFVFPVSKPHASQCWTAPGCDHSRETATN